MASMKLLDLPALRLHNSVFVCGGVYLCVYVCVCLCVVCLSVCACVRVVCVCVCVCSVFISV